MALKTRSRSRSVGQDDSPEDILTEKYRSADSVREVNPSERRHGGGREHRRAVDYERDAGESHRRRCPSRPVARGTTSCRNAVGGGEKHGGRAQAGLGALDAVATTRSRCGCEWRGRRLRRGRCIASTTMIFVCKKGAGFLGKGHEKRRRQAALDGRWGRKQQSGGIDGVQAENREDINEDQIATHQSSSALDTIEAGNEWPVHIVVVVLYPRGAGVHVELNLIGVRSMSEIKTALLTPTNPVEKDHPLLTLGTAATTLQRITIELQNRLICISSVHSGARYESHCQPAVIAEAPHDTNTSIYFTQEAQVHGVGQGGTEGVLEAKGKVPF
ncbi:hypothetical protein B0H13DRAFT_2292763 [Mycena leptocephala]|nr:hypothetical protein B0H13DRAFT_2292763 [Mycena leptocephala]